MVGGGTCCVLGGHLPSVPRGRRPCAAALACVPDSWSRAHAMPGNGSATARKHLFTTQTIFLTEDKDQTDETRTCMIHKGPVTSQHLPILFPLACDSSLLLGLPKRPCLPPTSDRIWNTTRAWRVVVLPGTISRILFPTQQLRSPATKTPLSLHPPTGLLGTPFRITAQSSG